MDEARSKTADSLADNRLLATLDAATRGALAPLFERVPMAVRATVYEDRQPFEHAYFPVDGVLSMIAVVEGAPDSMIEVATVGNEGMVGLPIFLGAEVTPGRAFAQVPGESLRIGAADLRGALARHPELGRVLHRYTQSLLVQVSQSTGCNRVHAPATRCARWILMTDDRVAGPTFDLTQEFLGQMLGERRPAVNEAASALQRDGLIRYVRGRMTVVDRPGLERAACGCYRIIRDEYARMLSDLASAAKPEADSA